MGLSKDVEFNVFSVFVFLFTAPLTDKPPKILSPSESQMSVIEMATGKSIRLIAHSDWLFPDGVTLVAYLSLPSLEWRPFRLQD